MAARIPISRATPLERLQTFVTVVIFTGLIWWMANQAVTETRKFTISVVGVENRRLMATFPQSHEFMIQVSAPKRLLDEFGKELASRNNVLTYRAQEDTDQLSVPIERRSIDIIRQTELVAASSVNVFEATPPNTQVRVDRLASRVVTIAPDFGRHAVTDTTVNPPTVSITMVEDAVSRLGDRLPIPAAGFLDETGVSSDGSFRITVPVVVPGADVSPGYVVISGRVTEELATREFGPVQILPGIPESVQWNFIVKPADEGHFRISVMVRGPTDRLDALQVSDIRAYFDVKTADEGQAGEVISRATTVILPPGLQLASQPEDVKFLLVKRSTATIDNP